MTNKFLGNGRLHLWDTLWLINYGSDSTNRKRKWLESTLSGRELLWTNPGELAQWGSGYDKRPKQWNPSSRQRQCMKKIHWSCFPYYTSCESQSKTGHMSIFNKTLENSTTWNENVFNVLFTEGWIRSCLQVRRVAKISRSRMLIYQCKSYRLNFLVYRHQVTTYIIENAA